MSQTLPKSPEAMMAVAEATLAALPVHMREAAARVSVRVEEFAEPAILDEFGIRDPHQLTGLYQGVPLIHESVTWPSPEGALIFLYRQPILAEWRARGDVTLEDLVAHVFIHELGHHFGWSDEEMDALLEADG
ncbi:MAG: hypothetical protein GVY06_11710 [Alphaproteobacteria bacterium]|jgi:predicted Zn-dependent protease with MMP-like domain|nr:hypothetical protein [Alphaproteobacteria bacterium]